MLRRPATLALLFVSLLGGVGVASPQAGNGSIRGTLQDGRSDDAIAGARITITHTQSGRVSTVASDSTGAYDISGLPQGTYRVRAETPGFFIEVYNDVQLRAGATVRLDFDMENGAPQEKSVVALGGIVRDEVGTPVIGVRVSLRDSRFARGTTRTDFDGTYHIPSVAPGTYSVSVEARGYRPASRDNVSFGTPGNLDLNFSLVPEVQSANAVAVRFQKRLAETHDVLRIIPELFISGFDDYVGEQLTSEADTFAETGQSTDIRAGTGLYNLFRIDPELVSKLQRGDRQNYVAQSINFAYLAMLGMVKTLPPNAFSDDAAVPSEPPPFEQLFPDVVPLFRDSPTLAPWLKEGRQDTVTVKTPGEFREAMSVVDRAVSLMRTRVSNPPAEQSPTFGMMVSGLETYMYNEGVKPQEKVCNSCGRFPAGTRFFQVMLTVPVYYLHVAELNGQLRIVGVDGMNIYGMKRD